MTFITMSTKELDRFHITKKLISKHLQEKPAARSLHLSVRQVRRLKAKVKKHGAKGLIHGNRGKESHHQLDREEKEKIIDLLHQRYFDFKPTFASEKLREHHGLDHGPKTIRQIMIDEGLWKPRSKRTVVIHRSWRERRSCFGEMIQFDGSYEHWFEDREGTGELCLLAGIDDATGEITKAEFAEHEGVFPVFAFWKEYLMKHGQPRSIYLDKFSTYNLNHPLAKENSDTLTQFERAAQELRIDLIKANSPQAKGRVERLFHTLQDRLIKELRLRNISTVPEANEFLEKIFIPQFNARFAVEPKNKTNLHRQLNDKEQMRLRSIFSRQSERIVLNDFTFSFKNQWHQITKEQTVTVCKKDAVIIEEHLDHTIHIRLRGKYLNFTLLPKRPEKQKKHPWIIAAHLPKSPAYIPPPDHPWRVSARARILQRSHSKDGTV